MRSTSVLLLSLLLASGATAQESGEIFVKRGNGIITNAQFDAWISRIPKQDQAMFLSDKNRVQQLLAQLLTNAQLASDAREAGFDQGELLKIRMQMAADAELAQAWMGHKIDSEPSDIDQLARELYLLHPGDFMTERAIDVTHLLVSIENRSDEEALALADDLWSQLKADPALFEELIETYSEDAGQGEGKGNYERVEKGDMVKPFEDKAFSLQIGEISEPVKTVYGYHLIRLNKVHRSELKDFESVKPGLILQARKQHENRIKTDYLNQLGSFPTELTEESLQEMLDRYVAEPESGDDTSVNQE